MSNDTNVGPVIKTRDVAFTFRMGAGSPGEVTRIHPASIFPYLNDASGANPLTYFGQAALFHGATNTVRAERITPTCAGKNTTVNIASASPACPFPFQEYPVRARQTARPRSVLPVLLPAASSTSPILKVRSCYVKSAYHSGGFRSGRQQDGARPPPARASSRRCLSVVSKRWLTRLRPTN